MDGQHAEFASPPHASIKAVGSGLVLPAEQHRPGTQHFGTRMALRHAHGCKTRRRTSCKLQGLVAITGGQREFGADQRDCCLADRCVVRVEQIGRTAQRFGSALRPRQQGLGAAVLRQGPGQFVGRIERFKACHRLLVERQCLGQQAQFEVSVGKLHFGDRLPLRHAEPFVAVAGALEATQRFTVFAARQVQQRRGLVDHCFEHREAVGRHAHAGTGVDEQRLVELAHRRERVRQADVGHDRVFMVGHPREQHGCFPIMLCGLDVGIARQVQAAQVEADLAGGPHVALGDEFPLGALGTGHGLVLLAQVRQGHDLWHLGLGGVVRLAQPGEKAGGIVEALGRGEHLPARELRNACCPGRQGFDFSRHRVAEVDRV